MWRWSSAHNAIQIGNMGILHVCGGDPDLPLSNADKVEYSPRMWRWSYLTLLILMLSQVFSTYVEVIPLTADNGYIFDGILHVCGGDPHARLSMSSVCQYSPRMWRWSP